MLENVHFSPRFGDEVANFKRPWEIINDFSDKHDMPAGLLEILFLRTRCEDEEAVLDFVIKWF